MTKKSQNSSKKQGLSPFLSIFIILAILLAGLFLLDRLGLAEVDWQKLLSQETLDEVLGTPASTPAPSASATSPATASAATVPPPAATRLPSGNWYKLYFSTPGYPDDPATRRETIMTGLIDVINSAQRSLDIAIYELDLDPIGDAILAARERGVSVRLVTDSDTLAEDETLIRLKKAKVSIVPDERRPIMHNKFVVVDGQAVWTGSWNFTANDTYRNNNNAIYIQSPEVAQNYAAEFEEMFSQKKFGPTSLSKTAHPRIQIGKTIVETCFGPEDGCANQLTVLIRRAQKSIRFMAFSFTHAEVGEAVIDRAKAGVIVQGVFETRGSETESSQLRRMKRQKLDVWQDGNPYTLHHKVFIIDDNIVAFGSFNFTDNADQSNDENMLIIQNPNLANEFLAEFNRVYEQAKNPPK